MKLCHLCLDLRDGLERQVDRQTTHGETCDLCRRIETENPAPDPSTCVRH